MPDIRVAFTGPAPAPTYELTNGRATDIGAGLEMSDRSPGWGLGAHAFIIGGIGRIADRSDATAAATSAKGAAASCSGPFGVDLSVKFTVNRFDMPVAAQRLHDSDLRARDADLLMRPDVARLARARVRRRGRPRPARTEAAARRRWRASTAGAARRRPRAGRAAAPRPDDDRRRPPASLREAAALIERRELSPVAADARLPRSHRGRQRRAARLHHRHRRSGARRRRARRSGASPPAAIAGRCTASPCR